MAANPLSEFMRYLAAHPEAENGLPPLAALSEELGVSVASLREQPGSRTRAGAGRSASPHRNPPPAVCVPARRAPESGVCHGAG